MRTITPEERAEWRKLPIDADAVELIIEADQEAWYRDLGYDAVAIIPRLLDNLEAAEAALKALATEIIGTDCASCAYHWGACEEFIPSEACVEKVIAWARAQVSAA